MNNFFTSTVENIYFFSQNIYFIDTVKKSETDIPNKIKTLKVGDVKYFQNKHVC